MGLFLSRAILVFSLMAGLRAQAAPQQVSPPPDNAAQSAEQSEPEKEQPEKEAEKPPQAFPPIAAPAETNETVVEEQNAVPKESAGPAVLSRSFELTSLDNSNLRFRPFFSFSSIADDGLTTVTTAGGRVDQRTDIGEDLGFGISGTKLFKRDKLELDFKGDVQRYNQNSAFDGGIYSLNLLYQHYLTRHTYLVLTENSGYYSNNYSLTTAATDLSTVSMSPVNTPNTLLFNNTTLFFSTAADWVIQKTARLSFDFGATGSLTRRESNALFGAVDRLARADVTYRVTRRLTGGAFYNFTHYDFIHAFGGSDINGAGFIVSYSLSRSLQLRTRFGGSRVYTTGENTFTLDPAIAQVLGTSTGLIVTRNLNYAPELSVQLAKSYRTGDASLEYINGVTPGNGLYLTSRRISFAGHYEYIGLRRWIFSAGAGRDQLSSLGVLTGNYVTTTGRIGVSRVLRRGFQGNFLCEVRHYDIQAPGLPRNSYRITLGVAWTPSERPLKLW